MKQLLMVICLGFFTTTLIAQQTISGKIVDDNNNPIKAATVLLLQWNDSSLLHSAITNARGEYHFNEVKKGKYVLNASSSSFSKTIAAIELADTMVMVAPVKLRRLLNTLGDVTIIAKKPFLEQKADKLVVNVENSATAAGSNALEILKKVPGVLIRNDKVSVAGKSNVMIMVDGRSSQYTDINQVLKDISAANISKIELVSNPGARYDAAGGAVINVILKKNANLGTNGSITLSARQGLYNNRKEGFDRNFYQYSPTMNLNHRKGKVNVFGSYSFNHRNWFEYNELNRVIAPNRYFQENLFYYQVNSHNYRAGMDFYMDKKNTFGLLVRGFNRDGGSDMTNNTLQFNTNTNQQESSFKTLNNIQLNRNNTSANANWKHQFDSTGKELNVDLDYSRFSINNNSLITINAGSPQKTINNQLVDNPVQLAVAKVDYVHPFAKGLKLETGFKSSFASIDNYLSYSREKVMDTSRSTDFIYKENINAAYASLGKTWSKWQLVAGIRAEQTIATGNLKNAEVLNRNYWQFFPSAFITRNINAHFSAVLQYSRRIDRPSYQQQNPFVLVLDSLTFTRGNPLLKPQLTNAFKFSFQYDNQPFFAVSYNHTDDVIFNDAPKQEGNITFTTPENLASFENLAFELNFPINIGKKISGFAGNQAILNHYMAEYLGGKYDKRAWNWMAYWQVDYKPHPTWTIEASGYYTTQFLTEFFTIGGQGSLGIAIQKSIWEKRGKFTLNFNDVFFSEKTSGNVLYQNIDVTFRQWEESRNVRLSFTWSFGNQILKAERSRKTAAEDEKGRVKIK